MTYVAFEMLCFLVLYQDLLIIKISVTIPAPRLQLLLLLATHDGALPTKQKGKRKKQEKRSEKERSIPRPNGSHRVPQETDRKSVV